MFIIIPTSNQDANLTDAVETIGMQMLKLSVGMPMILQDKRYLTARSLIRNYNLLYTTVTLYTIQGFCCHCNVAHNNEQWRGQIVDCLNQRRTDLGHCLVYDDYR